MFNEANSVEDYVRDLLCGKQDAAVREPLFKGSTLPALAAGLGWQFIPADQLPRTFNDVLIEAHLRQALIRLNPEIAEKPDRADEVIYKLRAIILSVQSDGLVRANEEFTAWLRGERSMPFGPNNQHTPVRLVDFDNIGNNHFVCTQQLVVSQKKLRPDLVLFINGIPVVVGEAKTPVRPAISWVDGAADIYEDYEINIPALFVSNVFSFATEGKTYRYGSIRMPLELWAPWRDPEQGELPGGLSELSVAVGSMLRPQVVLDILSSFSLFATDKKRRKIKVICRYQQYQAANQIVERVLVGLVRKGLIWHFQGSGKSLLMVFAAQKLRLHPALKNPTVIIVVDRIDLDTQITATFNTVDVPNIAPAASRGELQQMLAQDVRKIIITTIHKFAESPGVLNDRKNIIVMVDEAHRTQEGDLGRKMREALPNAFLFGLTGTPINRADRNTFWAFGADEDQNGYLSRYSFEDSIRDKATLPLHFEARLVQLRIDKDAIDEAFKNITGHMSEEDQAELSKMAAKMGVLVKSPERIQTLARDIVEHYQAKVEPNGFKAQVVVFDRESCHLFKQEFDKLLPAEASAVVMTTQAGDPWKAQYERSKDDEERLLDQFRDPAHPLKFLIVTSKLLTGFDAPILQVMYLDKPMKDHTLLQAICRTNRPYPGKSHGLVVDYLGVFDDVGRALMFDEKSVRQVITNLDEVKGELPKIWKKCVDYFPGVNRKVSGYEGLIAAQQCLPSNEKRDAFAADFSVFAKVWEALSPDSCLNAYEDDYRWLGQVYESIKPPSGNGKLLWHSLGAKTVELIHKNIHVEAVQDNLETLVMDEKLLKEIIESQDPTKIVEIEINIIARIRKHSRNPKFVALGKRLEDLKERHEKGLLTSLAFLKLLLELAKDVVAAEKEVVPAQEQDRGKAALTELFKEIKNANTPVVVERIVSDIDAIVRAVRFDGWQQTTGGEREIKKALRSTLLKYQLHREQELFDRAYEYIRQYY